MGIGSPYTLAPSPSGERLVVTRGHWFALVPNLSPQLPPIPMPRAICTFYLRGQCHYGADCSFSHAGAVNAEAPPVCSFFLAGSCNRGASCHFTHASHQAATGSGNQHASEEPATSAEAQWALPEDLDAWDEDGDAWDEEDDSRIDAWEAECAGQEEGAACEVTEIEDNGFYDDLLNSDEGRLSRGLEASELGASAAGNMTGSAELPLCGQFMVSGSCNRCGETGGPS